jgi:PAS domain S-box-containing protein
MAKKALRILDDRIFKLPNPCCKISDLKPTIFKQQQVYTGQKRFFQSIAVKFVFKSAILLSISVFASQSLTNFLHTSQWQIQHYKVLDELENIQILLDRARIAKLRYINTGDEEDLTPYYEVVEIINQEIDQLRETIGNQPAQQRQLAILTPLIEQKFNEIANIINIRRVNGFTATLQPVLLQKATTLSAEIDETLYQMEAAERILLKEQSLLVQTKARQAILTFSSGIFLTFLLLGAIYYRIYREIVERKRTQTLLEQERDFSSAILDTSSALVIVFDTQGRIIRFNKACEQTTGYSFAEVKGKPFWDLFLIPEEMNLVRELFNQLRSGDFPNQCENYWVTRNGDRRLISWSNTALLNPEGTVEYIIGTGIDISDRKLVQEAMKRQLAAVEAASDGIAILNQQGEYIYLNQAHVQIFGYDNAQTLISKTWREFYPSDEITRFEGDIFPILQQKRQWQGEATAKRRDGSTFAEEVSLTLLEDGNLICVCRDITDRKQIEEELRQQSLALECAIEGIARLDVQGRYITVNKAYANLVGYEPEEMIGITWQSTVHPDDRTNLMISYQQMLADGKAEAEARGLRKDSSFFYKQVTMVSAWDDDHNFIGHYCFAKDISDRKLLEAELQAREERFRVLVTHAPVGIFQTDSQGNCLFVNPRWSELTGLSLSESLGTGWSSVLHPDDWENVFAEWYNCARTGREFSMEYRFRTPQNQVNWVFGRATAIYDELGAIAGYFGTVTDITKRKQTEIALQESEERLQHIISTISDGLIVVDQHDKIRFVNPAAESLFGRSQSELVGHLFGLPCAAGTSAEICIQHSLEKQVIAEMRVGEIAWEKEIAHLVSLRDITERYQAEQALHESEEKYRRIVETAAEGIWIVDRDSNTNFVNRQITQMLGYTVEEMIGKSLFDFMDEEGKFLIQANVEHGHQGIQTNYDVKFRRRDGTELWAIASTNPLFDGKGNYAGALGMITDITVRKQAEEQLKASLQEKEILLKEVHHRVKNNLQVIDSLFRHQCRHSKDLSVIQILKECQNRVNLMALLHEKLYQSKDLVNIDFAGYLKSLVANLFDSYRINGNFIQIEIDVESIFLDIETSLACGSIVNELISNSFKYAFPKDKLGKIQIRFFEENNESFTLAVRDNGIGLPEDFDIEKTTSLGLKLVKSFVRQLEGNLRVTSQNCSEFIITFIRRK